MKVLRKVDQSHFPEQILAGLCLLKSLSTDFDSHEEIHRLKFGFLPVYGVLRESAMTAINIQFWILFKLAYILNYRHHFFYQHFIHLFL